MIPINLIILPMALLCEEEQRRHGQCKQVAGSAKVGKPVRETEQSGLQPPLAISRSMGF